MHKQIKFIYALLIITIIGGGVTFGFLREVGKGEINKSQNNNLYFNNQDYNNKKDQIEEICKKIVEGGGYYFDSLPASCNIEIGDSEPHVLFSFLPFHKIRVTRGEEILFSGESDTESISRQFFNLIDVNYDGYKDIEITTSCGAYQCYEEFFVYSPQKHIYESIPIVKGTEPEFDKKNQTITFFSKGRGLGDVYQKDTYQFLDGIYLLVRIESQDMVDYNDKLEYTYIHKVEVLKNGQMVLIENKKFTKKEVDGL